MVDYICDIKERHLNIAKVIKILDWPELTDLTGTLAFLSVCVYYQIWIFSFAIIAKPIYQILKKRMKFVWEPNQAKAIYILKYKLISLLALISINYTENAGAIILSVDTSLIGWEATLIQIWNSKQHFVRYKSGIWTLQEKIDNAIKWECQEVFKALKKMRHWLYSIYFILKTVANILVS